MEEGLAYNSNNRLKIGILREGKVPPDARVPLTPAQCVELVQRYPEVDLVVQPSPVRRIPDTEYRDAGVVLQEDLSDRDVLLGVKEVNVGDLLPDKTYLFFSHTFKLQPYNARLLAAVLDRRIRLIDYEVLRRPSGKRIIGFGRWAGLVGTYNGFRAYGMRSGRFSLPPAYECKDLKEMLSLLSKHANLPDDFKIVLTGWGRVGLGAKEVLDHLKIRCVHIDDFLRMDYPEPVYVHLQVEDYNVHREGRAFNMPDFVADPTSYRSDFMRFAERADLFVAGHFWAEGSPFLFTRADMRSPRWNVQVVADISCDIDGPVACTLRASTIEDPFYGYDPRTEQECAADDPAGITVMAVDNLPCELPRDASEGFGRDLMEHVLPLLIRGDRDDILSAASETTLEGKLHAPYAYLADYAAQGRVQLAQSGELL